MTPFIGQIMMFGGNFAPRGWALCDGQLLAINTHSALFSILGTTYGGDGRSTFGLPDLRGRFPMHMGTGAGLTPAVLGKKSGAETVTLTVNQMPSHSHTVNCEKQQGGDQKARDNYPAQSAVDTYNDTLANPDTMASGMIANTGGGQPFNIMNPHQVVTFCIALEGVYPSRN